LPEIIAAEFWDAARILLLCGVVIFAHKTAKEAAEKKTVGGLLLGAEFFGA
jgi:hypothetical protein